MQGQGGTEKSFLLRLAISYYVLHGIPIFVCCFTNIGAKNVPFGRTFHKLFNLRTVKAVYESKLEATNITEMEGRGECLKCAKLGLFDEAQQIPKDVAESEVSETSVH